MKFLTLATGSAAAAAALLSALNAHAASNATSIQAASTPTTSTSHSPTLTWGGPSATSEAAIADIVMLMWPNWTMVDPVDSQVPWTGGNGMSWATFQTADDGFGVETFELNIYDGSGPWDALQITTHTNTNDSAICTISANRKVVDMEAYVLMQYPPYFESVYDTPDPVTEIHCTKQ